MSPLIGYSLSSYADGVAMRIWRTGWVGRRGGGGGGARRSWFRFVAAAWAIVRRARYSPCARMDRPDPRDTPQLVVPTAR